MAAMFRATRLSRTPPANSRCRWKPGKGSGESPEEGAEPPPSALGSKSHPQWGNTGHSSRLGGRGGKGEREKLGGLC